MASKKNRPSGEALGRVIKNAIETANAEGLTVVEHFPGALHTTQIVNHLTLVGGMRKVDFYPTTDTVYANPVHPIFPKCVRGKGIHEAIRIAKKGK